MSQRPVEPLDPELDALLAAERSAPAPDEALARIGSRLALPMPPAGGGGSQGGPAGGASGLVASKLLAISVAVVVAGGGIGAGALLGRQRDEARRPRVSLVTPPASPSAPAVPVAAARIASTPVPTLTPSPLPPPIPARTAPAALGAPAAVPSTLSRERSLLDRARSAIASGAPELALSILDEHERDFRQPQLAGEREVLAVQALVASGRYDEARLRGARFRAKSPDSLFLPAIEASLASIP